MSHVCTSCVNQGLRRHNPCFQSEEMAAVQLQQVFAGPWVLQGPPVLHTHAPARDLFLSGLLFLQCLAAS